MRAVAFTTLTALAVLACSGLNDVGDGIVALEIRTPATRTIETGDTLQLHARALDKNGDSVAATIGWRTNDTTVIVNPTTGEVIGHTPGFSPQVQAFVGSLASGPVTVTVVSRADSIILVGPDTSSVLATEPASAPLVAQLMTNQPAGPLANRQMIYTVIDPAFADPATRTVELPGGLLADTVTTGADGRPLAPVTLNRITAVTSPDSAIVEVRAFRTRGAPVPGSGQRFIVRFR